jgi:hypothetical protein
MAHPLIKYTLTKQGRQPEWLCKEAGAFKGEHGTPANKPGKLPRFGSPQDTIFLGLGCGDVDPDGTPDGYVGSITSKADLQTYITEVGTAAGYKVITATVTGVSTSTTVGLTTAWESGVGLTTTTTDKVTFTGTGDVVSLTGSLNTSIVTEVQTSEGTTTDTVTNAIVVDQASTVTTTGVSTAVGVTTTGDAEVGFTTTTTTTTTTSYSYTDVTTSTSTSRTDSTTDGVTTRTDVVTTTETTNYETAYDYAAEATRLWDLYEAINA